MQEKLMQEAEACIDPASEVAGALVKEGSTLASSRTAISAAKPHLPLTLSKRLKALSQLADELDTPKTPTQTGSQKKGKKKK
mmetsp:Transcript_43221/g.112135  ORF Transcript_43221/g.112135 Transcript_43221/m.112135 type:complete len:82 (+) Transcript_43221:323-568(+)|eukprot:CAMPEP_0113874442 /NCGR_PEP_ID=MMETSP0780_2-20120614/4336_1 /TAXON_ID=652834 /ORGANISM="Palpitomonas bilix" /LENGTH=81 /DNA_ID=CAMNT_0000860215 /DNA_START=492 /DNA_END=737 /DNA_ORIENTATION=+ /assembly_acc=CAM_ASM_000599